MTLKNLKSILKILEDSDKTENNTEINFYLIQNTNEGICYTELDFEHLKIGYDSGGISSITLCLEES